MFPENFLDIHIIIIIHVSSCFVFIHILDGNPTLPCTVTATNSDHLQ